MAVGKICKFASMLMPGLILLLILETLDAMDYQDTFLYFAYGSNLLKERLQLNNPSARIHCVANLQDYKLAFVNHKGQMNPRWCGGVATIVPSPGDDIWGVVWRMNVSDLNSLDSDARQEGVELGIYSPKEVSVRTSDEDLRCRTYMMNNWTLARPSPQYLKVIVTGAQQNGLPQTYQEKLKAIETNKFEGLLSVMTKIEDAVKNSTNGTP